MTATSPSFLPYGRQVIDEDDIAAVTAVLRSDFLTTGPTVKAFEAALAHSVKASEAVVCSSGTSALHLALLAAGVGEKDAVIVPSVTFIAGANMVCAAGAELVLADVDPLTGLMGVDQVEAAAKRAVKPVKAIMPVHLNGNAGDYQALIDLAEKKGWWVITDGCHALGSLYQGRDGMALVGSDQTYDRLLTCFSFHPVKTIAMGEGGAITTHRPGLADLMRSLRHHGIKRQKFQGSLTEDYSAPWYHEFAITGYNYRASDLHCALGLSQLHKLPAFIEKRQALMQRYRLLLSDMDGMKLIADYATGHPVWHLMVAHFNWQEIGLSRRELVDRLKADNVGSQVHYIPLYRQPLYAGPSVDHFKGAEAYYASVLSLPLYASMTEKDVDWVVAAIKKGIAGGA